jgi:hypothetical protein
VIGNNQKEEARKQGKEWKRKLMPGMIAILQLLSVCLCYLKQRED